VLTFTEQGYLEVRRADGALVSRHRQEREAIESVIRDSGGCAAGAWTITRPTIHARLESSGFVIDARASLP